MRNLAYGLLSDETIDGSIIAPVDEAQAAAFAASVDPIRLADLALVEVRVPEPEVTSSERYLDTVAQIAATYAADEMVERLALIELDGETFGLGLSLLRYSDEWSVSTQSSTVGGTSPLGTAEPMTRRSSTIGRADGRDRGPPDAHPAVPEACRGAAPGAPGAATRRPWR